MIGVADLIADDRHYAGVLGEVRDVLEVEAEARKKEDITRNFHFLVRERLASIFDGAEGRMLPSLEVLEHLRGSLRRFLNQEIAEATEAELAPTERTQLPLLPYVVRE